MLLGTGFLASWVLAGPDRDTIHTEWTYVLPFSAALATLALLVPTRDGALAGARM